MKSIPFARSWSTAVRAAAIGSVTCGPPAIVIEGVSSPTNPMSTSFRRSVVVATTPVSGIRVRADDVRGEPREVALGEAVGRDLGAAIELVVADTRRRAAGRS
jgi:hypothetical protein